MSTTATYLVTGMTCEHCVKAVTEEISSLTTVLDVTIDLHPEDVSIVTVTSTDPLDSNEVAAAIDEAGYALAEKGSPS